ncbi:uncharacterized protein LOC144700412 [Wolffia australiana]
MAIPDGPTLTLVVEKGPRNGDSVECRWGGRVKIGRVVKGNTFPIKDPSISQAHVAIAGGNPSLGRVWTITDLGSSNGTFLNGAFLEPSVPALLHTGDTIKIGERTTIRVEIADSAQLISEDVGRARTRPRRAPPCLPSAVAPRKRRPASKTVDPATVGFYPVSEERIPEEICSEEGEKKPLEEVRDEAQVGVDLERMTLEEWFDRMEKYLPQVIREVADEVVDKIRADAKTFEEYIEHGPRIHD